jgi:hypothetical protein
MQPMNFGNSDLSTSWCVYIWIVSVRNLRVSIYSVFYNILFYYVIIIITYLLKCFLVAPIMNIYVFMYFCNIIKYIIIKRR